MGMTTKMKNSLNQLWKNLPGLRGGTESTNMRLGDLLAPMDFAVVACQSVTLAAAATTAVTVADAKTGDVAFFVLALQNTGAVKAARAEAAVSGTTVTITPDATPSNPDGVGILVVMRAVSSTAAGHSENPGA